MTVVGHEQVEVAAGVVVACDVVETLLGSYVRMPPLDEVLTAAEVSWWGFAPVSGANLFGLSTQVANRTYLVADTDPRLHPRLLAAVEVRTDRPWRSGLGWAEVSTLEILGDTEWWSELSEEATIDRLAEVLADHLDLAALAAAAALEGPVCSRRVASLVARLT